MMYMEAIIPLNNQEMNSIGIVICIKDIYTHIHILAHVYCHLHT